MSHNQNHYKKRITSKTSEKCKKIDILFKQHALSVSEITSTTVSKKESPKRKAVQ
jgi:hypothetical protein